MNEFITIGHYAAKAKTADFETVLDELRSDNISMVIESAPETCPYDKFSDKSKYKNWKSNHLPLVFFSNSIYRPEKHKNTVSATGYAMIDIDYKKEDFEQAKPIVKYVSNHPSICHTNYTKTGTHFIIHSYKLCGCKNYQEWQDVYNSIAYEIWNDICNNYKDDIKFDGHSSLYYWGCYLWNTEWKSNPYYDREWMPEERYLQDNVISEMYDAGTYTRMEAGIYKDYSKKANRETHFVDKCSTMTEIGSIGKISDRMSTDFRTLSYFEFLDKYAPTYTNITGTVPVFSDYTDYEGNTYKMYETNGSYTLLWNPFMQSRDKVPTKNGIKDYKIKIGGRRKSLASHLIQACQFSADNLNPDNILYDAVHWIVTWCEEGWKFPKTEIMSTVTGALKKYDTYENRLHPSNKMFITGDEKIDSNTGEVTCMDKGDKIRANAKCRRTVRLIDVVEMWDPSKDFEWNADHIRSWNDDGGEEKKNPTNYTIKQYLKDAQNMPSLVSQYNWLLDIEFNQKGRKKQPISILDTETNEVIEFNSKKECMEWLGCSSKTFSKLLKDTSKQYKQFKLLNDSNDFKDSKF